MGNMKKGTVAVCGRFGACAGAACGNFSKNGVWYGAVCGAYHKNMPIGERGRYTFMTFGQFRTFAPNMERVQQSKACAEKRSVCSKAESRQRGSELVQQSGVRAAWAERVQLD